MRYKKIIEFADIKVSLLAVWKNISKCLVLGLLFLAVGIVLTMGNGVENAYSASSSLYCPVNGTYSETSSAVQIISSYASLIKSQKVAEKAVSYLGNTNLTYKDILNMVSYTTNTSGINLTISAFSVNQDEAVSVANAVANAYVDEMRTMIGTEVVQILSAADKAILYENGVTRLWKTRISFFAIGTLLMALIIFVFELFSDKIRSVDQCLLTDEDVILGIIPEIDSSDE